MNTKTTTTTTITTFIYEAAEWTDPQGITHEAWTLTRKAGTLLHPETVPNKQHVKTQATHHNPIFVWPANLVTVKKVTKTITETVAVEVEIIA